MPSFSFLSINFQLFNLHLFTNKHYSNLEILKSFDKTTLHFSTRTVSSVLLVRFNKNHHSKRKLPDMTKKKTDIPLFPGENSSHSSRRGTKFGDLLRSSEPTISLTSSEPDQSHQRDGTRSHDRHSNVVSYIPSPVMSPNSSPGNDNFSMSPFYQTSPFSKSPWNFSFFNTHNTNGLIGSLVREEGHVYSLASSGDLLYTGSDSRNIRVWRNLTEFSGFKSTSGLVKAIVVSGERVFTGHQDGKIRVWKYYPDYNSGKKGQKAHKRVGSLPTTRDFIISSMNPGNYVEVRRHRNVPWIKHFDVVSCMSLDEENGLLYSGSWDKTLKVWRLLDSKCLESINAHDDAVNSVVAGFEGLVLTGSADGSVKVWRRELVGKETKHMMVYVLINQEAAITSLTVTIDKSKTTGSLFNPVTKTLTNSVHDSHNSHGCHGAIVYAGSSDGLVNFWERKKHMLVHGGVIRGHRQAVLCLASVGPLLFSGSADKSICVWRREADGFHTCLNVLTGHDGPIKCLTVQEQGDGGGGGGGDREWVVYSGSLDKSVKLWRLSERAWK